MRKLDIDDLDEDLPLFGLSCFNLQTQKPEVMILSMTAPDQSLDTCPFEHYGTGKFPSWSNGWRGFRPLTATARAWWKVAQDHTPRRKRRA